MRLGSWTRRSVLANLVLPYYYSLPPWLEPNESNWMQEILRRKEGLSLQELRRSRFQPLINAIGNDASMTVLLGEATHGTEEFYRIRSEITKALLEQADFDAVLCEGDYAPFGDLNQFASSASSITMGNYHHQSADTGASLSSIQLQEALLFAGLDRFPVWMWRNDAFAEFVAWLRDFNNNNNNNNKKHCCKHEMPVQLVGLDIYSMFQSMDQVLTSLEQLGETILTRNVRDCYAVLDQFRPEASDYANAVFYDMVPSQEQNVNWVLKELRKQREERFCVSSNSNEEASLYDREQLWRNALENARVVAASELFHRQLLVSRQRQDDGMLWNIREAAMFQTLRSTRSYLEQTKGSAARLVVWAHNSHIGDARATNHGRKRGGPPHFNLGQLCRQVSGDAHVYTVGFTCNEGTVRAAREWGEDDHVVKLLPAVEGSHEYLLGKLAATKGHRHNNVVGYCLRSNSSNGKVDEAARELFSLPRIQRYVGVSYAPDTEIRSHYSTSSLSEGFDFVIHVDQSTAVKVDRVLKWNRSGGSVTSTQRPMYLLDAFGKDESFSTVN